MPKLDKSYVLLEELCINAQDKINVEEHYATLVKVLRQFDLITAISLAQDTTPNLTDTVLLNQIIDVVCDESNFKKFLYPIEDDDEF